MNDRSAAGPAASSLRALRLRAEAMAAGTAAKRPRGKHSPFREDAETLSLEAAQKILHAMQVQQIELEMQNEELRRVQVELDAARARYFALYDLAPVGYCTLSERGLILQTNFTAATLLGVTRGAMVEQAFSRFIGREDQETFHRFRTQLFANGEAQACELCMVRHDGTQFLAHLEATVAQDNEGAPICLLALNDNPELQKAAALLRFHSDILNSLTEGVHLVRISNGEMVFTNPPFDRMFGYGPGELLGKHVSCINAPGASGPHATANLIMAELARTGKWQGEIRNIRKDGTVFWSHANVTTLDHQRYGRVWVSVHQDITERRRFEIEREQYLKFFRLSTDLMCIADQRGCFVQVNPAFIQLTGFAEAELAGKPFLDLVLPEDRQMTVDEIKRQIDSHLSASFENRYVCKDGRVILLSWNAYLNQDDGFTYATARDITATRYTQLEIDRVGENFRVLFEAISDPVLINGLDGRFILVNPAACHSLGYTQEEMLRIGPAEINTPEAAATVPARMQELLGKGSLVFESTHLRKDGVVIPVELNARLIEYENKPAFIVVARDITERKHAENQLRDIAMTLEQQVNVRTARLRAVSAQLAMTEERERRILAQELHDNLSQLLAVIKIKLTSIAADSFESSVNDIVALVDRADGSARLITRELSPQILHTLGFMPALVSLAKDKKRMFNLTVHIDCDREPEFLEDGMRAVLYRSVRELLCNIGKHAQVNEAYLVCRVEADRLQIIVRDNGCGFDALKYQDATREFDGFGLSSVYERVLNVGGEMVIESSPGHGTTIALSLPYAIATQGSGPS